jgi:site-specific DNA-methyltransferase (adenine-specific)
MEMMKRYPDKYFDLAIVDPPFFSGPDREGFYDGAKGKPKTFYKDLNNWSVPKNDYYIELCRVSKEQIIWGINYFNFIGVPHGRIVWDKRKNIGCSFSDGEIASCSLINSVRFFRYRWNGMIQENMKKKEIRIHPTQKPVRLYSWILQNYSEPGQKILDTHLGSGSIVIACYDMGFDIVACGIDPVCFSQAERRINEHIVQGELFSPNELFLSDKSKNRNNTALFEDTP